MGDAPVTIHCTKPRSQLARALKEAGAEVVAVEVDGDVPRNERCVLSPAVAVDRYTNASFARAIADKTLFVQAIDLRETFATPALVLEGEELSEYSAIHPRAVRGAVSALVIEYGLCVLRTTDVEDTADVLMMMAAHAQHGVPEISLNPKRKALDVPDGQRRVVEMLPGAGLVGARRLLQRFGALGRLLVATEEELCRVPGFGAKKAAAIRAVLTAEYRALDTEQDIEEALARRPELMFGRSLDLLARQHVFFGPEGDKYIIDLVLQDRGESAAYVVELKRGPLTRDHARQLSAYLDQAAHSELLLGLMTSGCELRGVLASPEATPKDLDDPRLQIVRLDREALMDELALARRERLAELEGTSRPRASKRKRRRR